jgi:ferrous iron transport protein B
MELPPYHAPRMRHIMMHTWLRLKVFIFRAGRVIVIAVLVLAFLNSLGVDGTFGNEDSSNSVLAKIGEAITPIFTPMGIEKDNWPASVGLFTGLFAKEAVVGTLNSLYSQADVAASGEEDEGFELGPALKDSVVSIPENLAGVFGGLSDPLGAGIISSDEEAVAEEVEADASVFVALREKFSEGPLQAYAYLLFILIYFPCVAALGAIVREIGRGYGWLSIAYLTVLAWITATLLYQITLGHQALWIVVPLALLGAVVGGFLLLRRRSKA